MYSIVVKKYGDPDILEYVKSRSQNIDDKSVKIKVSAWCKFCRCINYKR